MPVNIELRRLPDGFFSRGWSSKRTIPRLGMWAQWACVASHSGAADLAGNCEAYLPGQFNWLCEGLILAPELPFCILPKSVRRNRGIVVWNQTRFKASHSGTPWGNTGFDIGTAWVKLPIVNGIGWEPRPVDFLIPHSDPQNNQVPFAYLGQSFFQKYSDAKFQAMEENIACPSDPHNPCSKVGELIV